MKIMLICVGQTRDKHLKEAIEKYTARIPHYIPFEIDYIPDIKLTQNKDEARIKKEEGERILGRTRPGDYLCLLDERGKEFTSREFSGWIEQQQTSVAGRLLFVIGGPYGFSEEVYNRCDSKISLSRMTFPHELARLFFTEQLYRAMTIMRNEPYHHD